VSERVETVIVGGGQAGLAISYHLSHRGRAHTILEQASQPADAWRNQRWDSFTLVTPNWTVRMPGAEYQGNDPDGFMPRDEVVTYFEDYIEHFGLPIQYGVRVSSEPVKISFSWCPKGNGSEFFERMFSGVFLLGILPQTPTAHLAPTSFIYMASPSLNHPKPPSGCLARHGLESALSIPERIQSVGSRC
jgi:hypothetical protein